MGAAAPGATLARQPTFSTVFGVDFSGAKLAGRTTWIARAALRGRGARRRLHLLELASLERLCGSAEREASLAHLVQMIRASHNALWAIDAPFGLPVEVLDAGVTWLESLRFVRDWEEGGYALGLWCLERAKALGGPMHIYRATDRAAKAPFDPYHYRIIFQTFHAMRDVVAPLARVRETAVLPFQYRRLPSARRVLVEACPSSTLKRLKLPHQNYKQPAGGPLSADKRRTRRAILTGLRPFVEIAPTHRRRIARDPGGDALDAVIAAVGATLVWRTIDHGTVARCSRTRREGYLYA
jgi:Protein of unknown function (DUF429)